MRPTYACSLLVVLALVLAAGCSSNNKGKLEKTSWRSEAATIKGRSFPAGAFEVFFRADGSMLYRAESKNITGRYSLEVGDVVIFQLDESVAGRTTLADIIVVEGDKMMMTDPDGTQLQFKRK
jgi:hypothetical protein